MLPLLSKWSYQDKLVLSLHFNKEARVERENDL